MMNKNRFWSVKAGSMSDCNTALTSDVIHKVLRGLLLGMSLGRAFRSAGVEPDVGYEWIREAEDEECHRQCYVLRRVVDEAFASIEDFDRDVSFRIILGGRFDVG